MSLERNGYEVLASIEPVVNFFEQITDIPRPSGKEDVIREHIVAFARERGFEARVDARGNLAFDVPASQGMEDKPRVVLQGHMDMVTVPGKNDIASTRAYIDGGGWMRAEGTTLGADNGIGVAMAMALADDRELVHGPLTVLITVHEESSPMGAESLDPNIVPTGAKFLINLDSEEGPEYICQGCAASCNIEADFEGGVDSLPSGYNVVSLSLGGLLGGHSGIDIHRGRGNAITFLNEFLILILSLLREHCASMKLLAFAGGTQRNVIPSSAEALIAVPHYFCAMVKSEAEAFVEGVKSDAGRNGQAERQLVYSNAQGLQLEVSVFNHILFETKAVQDKTRDVLLAAIRDFAFGPMEVDGRDTFTGGVLLSNSPGLLTTETGLDQGGIGKTTFHLSSMARGAKLEALRGKVAELKRSLKERGATRVESNTAGGAWLEDENSPAIKNAVEVARDLGYDPQVFAYHAGLEVAYIQACLAERSPDLAAVSLGPQIADAHSDQERVSLKSMEETYVLIRAVLQKIATFQ